jgi:hypothetical protein
MWHQSACIPFRSARVLMGGKPRLSHKVALSAKEKHKAALSAIAAASSFKGICCFIGDREHWAPQRDTSRGANSASFVQTNVSSASIR